MPLIAKQSLFGDVQSPYANQGSIKPGKLAVLVVLGRDPLKENPSTPVTIPIVRTMVGGAWKFEAQGVVLFIE